MRLRDDSIVISALVEVAAGVSEGSAGDDGAPCLRGGGGGRRGAASATVVRTGRRRVQSLQPSVVEARVAPDLPLAHRSQVAVHPPELRVQLRSILLQYH